MRLAIGARSQQIVALVLTQTLTIVAWSSGTDQSAARAGMVAIAAVFANATGLTAIAGVRLFAFTGALVAIGCALSAMMPALGASRVRPADALQ